MAPCLHIGWGTADAMDHTLTSCYFSTLARMSDELLYCVHITKGTAANIIVIIHTSVHGRRKLVHVTQGPSSLNSCFVTGRQVWLGRCVQTITWLAVNGPTCKTCPMVTSRTILFWPTDRGAGDQREKEIKKWNKRKRLICLLPQVWHFLVCVCVKTAPKSSWRSPCQLFFTPLFWLQLPHHGNVCMEDSGNTKACTVHSSS